MNTRRITYINLLLLTASLFAFLAFGLRMSGYERAPVGLGIADTSQTVEQFCTALSEWDHETVEQLISGYSDLNLNPEPKTEFDGKLRKCFTDSFECSVVGDGVTEGMRASQDIRVRFFSYSLAADDIKKLTQKLYDELLASDQDSDAVYDLDGNLLESVATGLYENAASIVMEDSSSYTTSRLLTLELVYENGEWKIELTDELANVLLGGFNN